MYLFFLCVNGVVLSVFVWFVLCPGLWGGDKAVWLRSYLVADNQRYSLVLLDPPSSLICIYTFCHYDCIYNLYTTIFCCESLLYSIHVCPFWERDPSSVAHPETSSVFGGKFFLLWNKTLRTDGVVFCTDCTDPWGKSRFMIWGYVKKIDLHWLDSGLESNWSSFPWNPRGIAITFMIWHICG